MINILQNIKIPGYNMFTQRGSIIPITDYLFLQLLQANKPYFSSLLLSLHWSLHLLEVHWQVGSKNISFVLKGKLSQHYATLVKLVPTIFKYFCPNKNRSSSSLRWEMATHWWRLSPRHDNSQVSFKRWKLDVRCSWYSRTYASWCLFWW